MEIDLTHTEAAVTRVALSVLVRLLDGLPIGDEDEIFGRVITALDQEVVTEGGAIQRVIQIVEKLEPT